LENIKKLIVAKIINPKIMGKKMAREEVSFFLVKEERDLLFLNFFIRVTMSEDGENWQNFNF